jgi:hypothetical protein
MAMTLATGSACLCACALAGSSGCFLPLQFEEETDAGIDTDYPPVLASSDPAMPGPIDITSTPTTVTLVVEDKDLGDTIFVRVFRDYGRPDPTPPRTNTRELPTGSKQRTLMLTTAGWCGGATTGQHVFEVLIADRDFLDFQVEPLFRALPDGAESSSTFWIGTCP